MLPFSPRESFIRFSNKWDTTVRSASVAAIAGSRVAGALSRHTRRVMVSRCCA